MTLENSMNKSWKGLTMSLLGGKKDKLLFQENPHTFTQ